MRKYYNLFLLCIWAHMVGAAVLGISAAFGNLVVDLGITFDDVTLGQGLCILFLGLGNLIWVPLANYAGRRPVYLMSTFILIFSQVLALSSLPKPLCATDTRSVVGSGRQNYRSCQFYRFQDHGWLCWCTF
jgi:MFS family permease